MIYSKKRERTTPAVNIKLKKRSAQPAIHSTPSIKPNFLHSDLLLFHGRKPIILLPQNCAYNGQTRGDQARRRSRKIGCTVAQTRASQPHGNCWIWQKYFGERHIKTFCDHFAIIITTFEHARCPVGAIRWKIENWNENFERVLTMGTVLASPQRKPKECCCPAAGKGRRGRRRDHLKRNSDQFMRSKTHIKGGRRSSSSANTAIIPLWRRNNKKQKSGDGN